MTRHPWSACALLVVLHALGTARAATAGVPVETITFGAFTCAPNWQPLNPGEAHFRVTNHSPVSATVYLFHSNSGAISATITHLKPGRTDTIAVRLTGGDLYAWSCDLTGYPIHISDAQQIPAFSQAGGPGRRGVPVTAGELIAPLQTYRSYAEGVLAVLGTQLATLTADASAGNLAAAKSAWLSAHLSWLDLGQDDGAYGAFGELGQSIDGTAAGLVGGTASSQFTGFHRIELDLWQTGNLTAAATDIAELRALVNRITPTRLLADTPGTTAGLTTFVTRVHESLEDGLRDTLSGQDDYGSGTGIASITADVTATREFLKLFAPLLAARSPLLVSTAQRQLTQVDAAADSTRVSGDWVAVAQLAPRPRERIDAATGAVLETLAPIPGILALGES